MRRWLGPEEIPQGWGRSVVTFGVFDGVHRGHQAVLERARQRARDLDCPLVVAILAPAAPAETSQQPASTLTPAERRDELLAAVGVDAVCVLPSTATPLAPADLVRDVLVDRLGATVLVAGEHVRFGGDGDVATLREFGDKHDVTVETVAPVADTEVITAQRIRDRLAAGDVEGAAAALGRPHRLSGTVVHGAARGRELLGYPTANLDFPPESTVPADGVYAGRLLLTAASPQEAAGETQWPAAISVGSNPTFEGAGRTVEAYALDRDDLDLYGKLAAVDFIHHIRPMLRFDSIDELIAAMARDVERSRELLLE
ncbi:bifunctional riboflavin kinase/FAD synthetase [Salinactinospora qingdaonensis]|uniref:bifunctional riboflavin kinase/FAD synthetase n=1 Tax=Salinactinospora qingdaonensis TaxID=702744 RepID=UPI0031EC43C7